jgi:hypothetical protein
MKAIAVAILCVAVTTLANGQEYPKAEIYGGYSYVNIDTNGISDRQNANGWEASVFGSFNRWLAAEADVAGYYKSFPVSSEPNISVTDYSYAAGPRFNIRPLFLHALIGGDHLSGSQSGQSESQDGLVGAFGGGAEWPTSKRWGVRVSADYSFSRHNIFGGPSYTQNNFRVGAGFVYRFGVTAPTPPTHAEHAPRTASRSMSGMPVPALGLVAVAREEGGAEIQEVAPGSVAALGGLRIGDVINSVNGSPIKTPMELQAEMSTLSSGVKVRIGYMARGYWQSETVLILK